MFWREGVDADKGEHSVVLKRGEITDNARFNDDGTPRNIPFKIYHPAPSEERASQFPVIFWSHGYGGSRDGAGFLARYIASHGYIVVHLTHWGTDSSLWEGKPGHPWEILTKLQISRSTTLNRYKDIPFVVDRLPSWLREHHPDIAAQTNWDKIGMSGHSFGAITTQVAAGQLTPDENGTLISLHDPRLTAGIAYSSVPGTSHLSNDDHDDGAHNIYETIQMPLLHMTGTQDSSPVNGMPYTDRLKIYDQTRETVPKALLVKEGGDHMVYNGTRGALAANALRDLHEAMIRQTSLAWWDAWLKDDEAAYKWLRDGAVSAYLGDGATWKLNGL